MFHQGIAQKSPSAITAEVRIQWYRRPSACLIESSDFEVR
jgi:hypothetical protein